MLGTIMRVVSLAASPFFEHHEVIQAAILLQHFETNRAGIFEARDLKIVHGFDRVIHALLASDDVDVGNYVNGSGASGGLLAQGCRQSHERTCEQDRPGSPPYTKVFENTHVGKYTPVRNPEEARSIDGPGMIV